jgi:hypothetical protein
MEALARPSLRRRSAVSSDWLVAGGWALLVLAGYLLGARLVDADPLVHVGAPPFVGQYRLVLAPQALAALALGGAGVAWGPSLATRLTWRALLPTAWLAGVAWMVVLALARPGASLAGPLRTRYEYLAAVPRVGDIPHFLSTYVARLATYPTHVKGHPPGFTVLLALLDRMGLGGATAAAFVVVAVGALAAPAALVALRSVAGAAHARAAAPFVVLTPAAVWMATSADALFAGVLAVGIALFALAAARRGVHGDGLAVGAGLVLGAALLCSYGVAPLGVIVVALAVHRRAWRALALATAGVTVVVGGAAALGFWWLDGLNATHALYVSGVAARRPYADFLVISLAAFVVATGPAPWVGFARLRERTVWLLPGAALAALVVTALTGLSKGETERIWLPFVPWIALAAGGLGRAWLATAVGLGLLVELGVSSPW